MDDKCTEFELGILLLFIRCEEFIHLSFRFFDLDPYCFRASDYSIYGLDSSISAIGFCNLTVNSFDIN